MSEPAPATGNWPSAAQELLLRACLTSGPDALQSWHDWLALIDFDDADLASTRLFPLLYRNLHAQALTGREMGRLKGFYRRAWYHNQQLFHAGAAALEALRLAGISTLILKGAALSACYYRDTGARPMDDIDILITPDQAFETAAVLAEAGWTARGTFGAGLTAEYMQAAHGAVFRNEANQQIDLHWYALPECAYEGADADYWRHALSAELNGAATLVPHPTEMLIHTLVHGYKWNRVPSHRWVADATTIMRTAPTPIDWQRLLTTSQHQRLTLPIRSTLAYLVGLLDLPIPGDVLRGLQAQPVSRTERWEYRMATQPSSTEAITANLWFRHARANADKGLVRSALSFPRALQHRFYLDHWWQLPGFAWRYRKTRQE